MKVCCNERGHFKIGRTAGGSFRGDAGQFCVTIRLEFVAVLSKEKKRSVAYACY